MDNDMIQKIYEETLPIVLNDVEAEFVESITASYLAYLQNNYSSVVVDYDKKNKFCSAYIKLEASKWRNSSVGLKKSVLLVDEALSKLGTLSNTALVHAQNRLLKNEISITEERANEGIALMQEAIPLVKSFNQDLANFYLSEGIMDFSYACGITDNMSLRVGRLMH